VNLLNVFRPSAWARLIDQTGRRYYPRLGPRFFRSRYIADGVMSQHDMSVLGPNPKRSDYRFYVTRTLAQHAAKLDGLFLSLGVAHGEHALAIMQSVRPNNPFWLIDSFDGRRSAAETRFKGGYITGTEEVRETFKPYPNVHILQGLIPAILPELPAGPIAWAHFNLADPESEAAALLQLAPRLVRGGVFIIDNFGRGATTDEHRKAYLAAVEKTGLAFLVLPTGHGLLFGA
jgi:hypothetical protein